MADEVLRWIKVAESVAAISFAPNGIAELAAGDRTICIGRHGDALYAFAHKCPHASGLFIEGYIDAMGNVVCPLHRYKFAMRNGRNITGEGYFLKNWPVEIREEGVFVGFEKGKLWGLL